MVLNLTLASSCLYNYARKWLYPFLAMSEAFAVRSRGRERERETDIDRQRDREKESVGKRKTDR